MERHNVDALARLLEGGSADPAGSTPQEPRALADLAGIVADLPTPQPRPVFTATLRTQLLEQARGDAATVRNRVSRPASMALAGSAVVVALATTGVAVATYQALPGDTLYPVKLSVEDTRTAMTVDDVERGERLLSSAADRVDEAQAATGRGDDEAAARSLTAADEAARDAAHELIGAYQASGDPRMLTALTVFSQQQRRDLQAVSGALRGPAVVAATDALTVLERIDERVGILLAGCPACSPETSAAFDYRHIPPASEAFQACPCPEAPLPEPAPGARPPQAETPGEATSRAPRPGHGEAGSAADAGHASAQRAQPGAEPSEPHPPADDLDRVDEGTDDEASQDHRGLREVFTATTGGFELPRPGAD